MRQFAQFPNGTALYNQYLTQAAIDRYLTENPFNASNALEQINTQYWINCFCDEYETFANWRRSGYPELKSTYDAAAVSRLSGGDHFSSRIWWDVAK